MSNIHQSPLIKIFDTHTHDYFDTFDEDRKEMLQQDFDSGVIGKIQIGCDIPTSEQAINLAKQYPHKIWATVGVHPCHVEENFSCIDSVLKTFQNMIDEDDETNHIIAGIGETGFDFFHNDSPELREQQEYSFVQHCKLAKKNNKAMVVHTRGARNETLQFFKNHQSDLPKNAVIHCFSEDADFATEITNNYGYMIGIGGVCTYKKNEYIREAIKKTDIKYIVTETDSPYLAPQKVRGTRNQSKNILEIIECIAEIKNIPLQECSEILVENARRLYQL